MTPTNPGAAAGPPRRIRPDKLVLMPRSTEPDGPTDKATDDHAGSVTGDLVDGRPWRDYVDALPDVLTTTEAAVLLRITESALLRICRQKDSIPVRRVGGTWRFSKTVLLQWLETGNDGGTPLRERPQPD